MKKTMIALAMAAPLALGSMSAIAAQDTLKIGTSQFPESLNPLLNGSTAGLLINGVSQRNSIVHNADWVLECLLCVEVPTLENGLVELVKVNGKDGMKITVTLKDDIYWGDGTPVTTKDVILSSEILKDERVQGNPLITEGKKTEKIVALDDKRYVQYLNVVDYMFGSLQPQPMPDHIEGEIYRNDPSSYHKTSKYLTDPANPALYNGPFVLTDVQTGSYIKAAKNPHWKGKQPEFDNLVFKIIGDTAALQANLLSGSIDYITGKVGLTLDQALQFEKRHGKNYNIVHKSSLAYEHLDVNLSNEHLANKQVRQALMYALDRETLVQQLFEGKQPVAASQTNPLDSVYSPDAPTYEYNPEKAKALLKQAGYSLKDGKMVNKQGKALEFDLMTTAGNSSRELVQQVLQSQWKKVGVTANIKNQTARVFFGETLPKLGHDGLAMFAWGTAPEANPKAMVHSSNIPNEANGFSGYNWSGYNNPVMDKLTDQIENELDYEKRKALFAEVQKIYAEDLPVLPLFFQSDSYVMPKWLEGVKPTGNLTTATHWVENWTSSK
ncbi:peptide ABC transporter substrate-binding protein [Veronia pacifica]|uniref:Peptide ABC transporter n=1 Tax=Veronia pacifica TaxID=1080227 RepID=A0A1C3EBM3_9GAMM|nr:peptide ABC transporter substrate-binding protein [Veronia pacifica]ODA30600.1 peptide ABC transporter [Veronia pacifica]